MIGPVALSALCLLAAVDTLPSPAPIDPRELDRQEQATESLANALLDLSVALRDGEFGLLGRAFLPGASVDRLPLPEGELGEADPWADRRIWAGGSEEAGGVELFIRSARDWHRDMGAIDDVRFKVKSSSLIEGGTKLKARIHYSLIGRSPDSRREWLRGWADGLAAANAEGDWRIDELRMESASSLRANAELFSEIGAPAGVADDLPPFRWTEGVEHGAAAGDLDRNGWIDIVATGPGRPHVYLNQGDGTFADKGALLGLQDHPRATAPLLLDWDNDGDLDLFLSALGPVQFYENRLVPEGALAFRNTSDRSDTAAPIGYSAISTDVDRDGYADIYVASYNRYARVFPDDWARAENGTPNLLFVNRGDGTFADRSREWGVDDRRWTYAGAFADLNEDGAPDLYLANDFGENALFLNRGKRYEDVAADWGVIDRGSGMGAAFGDIDNDGVLDLHVTNMSSTAGKRIIARLYGSAPPPLLEKLAAGNSLYRRVPGAGFENWTKRSGGLAAGWAWGGGFFDFDNDGWQDLYTPAGFVSGASMHDT